LIGFFWEWIREGRVRSEARESKREVVRLEREVGRLRVKKTDGEDEVLAMLDADTAR